MQTPTSPQKLWEENLDIKEEFIRHIHTTHVMDIKQ